MFIPSSVCKENSSEENSFLVASIDNQNSVGLLVYLDSL